MAVAVPISCSVPPSVRILASPPPPHGVGGKACDNIWGRCPWLWEPSLAWNVLGAQSPSNFLPEDRLRLPPDGSWPFSQRSQRTRSLQPGVSLRPEHKGRASGSHHGSGPGSAADRAQASLHSCVASPMGTQACPALHLVKVTPAPHALPILPPRQGTSLELITAVLILSSSCF